MKIRPLLAPEVIQSTTMDCGPASLQAMLAGHGIETNYDYLRELCQTSVDGTSIDMLEQLCNDLSIEAIQQMLPVDALADCLVRTGPSILTVSPDDSGAAHFVACWSRVGPYFQVMDPGIGRQWWNRKKVEARVFLHTQRVPVEDWLEIMGNTPYLGWLAGRISRIGLRGDGNAYLRSLIERYGVGGVCAADTSARLVNWLIEERQTRVGPGAVRLFEHCIQMAFEEMSTGQKLIPAPYWFARLNPEGSEVSMRGAVMLVPTGQRLPPRKMSPRAQKQRERLREPQRSPLSGLWQLLRRRDLTVALFLLGTLVVSSFGSLAELMIFRASTSIVERLGVMHQRLAALVAFSVFLALLLLLDYLIFSSSRHLGRQLEVRLRVALFTRIPQLPDTYFRTRLLSDMAQRAHQIRLVRSLPSMVQDFLRVSINLFVTVAAISLLHPSVALVTIGGALLASLVPLLLNRWLFEIESKQQMMQASLSSFYLEALAGLVPLRTHGAEQALIREQQKAMSSWFETALQRQGVVTWQALFQSLFSVLLTIAIIFTYLRQGYDPQGLLLLLFWAQRIPALGQAFTQTITSVAPIRSSLIRVFEPLADAHASHESAVVSPGGGPLQPGVDLKFQDVSMVAGGQIILKRLRLHIRSGEHVAIVGRSGAGKSSLMSLLLGIYAPATGEILIDDQTMSAASLMAHMRAITCWVDPSIELWNDTLLRNIQFGVPHEAQRPIRQVVAQADLVDVLDRLAEGLQTSLGDSGSLVSGGEGQRVRLARAMLRKEARLVLLDEPFRGLDRTRRGQLLERAQTLWSTSTILCVTHDVTETQAFDRVLVVHEGRIVEDGTPAELLAQSTHYRQLLEADQRAAQAIWSDYQWRHIRVQDGQVHEGPSTEQP